MTKELEFLIKTAKEAADIITDDFIVKAKDDNGDLVTNFDTEVEQFIISRIKKEYPAFSVISEELNGDKPLADNCFVIDPIDGTVNFAHHLPLWGIMIACIKAGKTAASVIYMPKLNEFYYADGTGAYLNDKKIHVSSLPTEKCMYDLEGRNLKTLRENMRKHSKHPRALGCACAPFAWVAAGRLEGMVITYDTVWDYIPGQFLVEQAGGFTYNAPGLHIAANSRELLNILRQESGINGI